MNEGRERDCQAQTLVAERPIAACREGFQWSPTRTAWTTPANTYGLLDGQRIRKFETSFSTWLANGWRLRCTSATASCVSAGHKGLRLARGRIRRVNSHKSGWPVF